MKRNPTPPDLPAFGRKRRRTRHGTEAYHYPSDLARQLLLYPAAVGRARTPPGESIDHAVRDRYLLHYVVQGELWHRIGARSHVARVGDACLMDLSIRPVPSPPAPRQPFRTGSRSTAATWRGTSRSCGLIAIPSFPA